MSLLHVLMEFVLDFNKCDRTWSRNQAWSPFPNNALPQPYVMKIDIIYNVLFLFVWNERENQVCSRKAALLKSHLAVQICTFSCVEYFVNPYLVELFIQRSGDCKYCDVRNSKFRHWYISASFTKCLEHSYL